MVGVTPQPTKPRTLAEKVWDAHVGAIRRG